MRIKVKETVKKIGQLEKNIENVSAKLKQKVICRKKKKQNIPRRRPL
jgi:hypothetical protein